MSIIYAENKSKKISEPELELIAQACEIQVKRDFAKYYGNVNDDFKIATVDPHCDCVLAVVDDESPSEEGVEADHFVDGSGDAEIECFTKPILENAGTVLQGPNSVSIAFSHEVLEYLRNMFTNGWTDTYGSLIDPHGKKWKQVCDEICDPVEDGWYDIDVGGVAVSVSNFVLPEWFNPQKKVSQRDFLNKLPHDKAFAKTEEGYLIVRDQIGSEHQIFGTTFPVWKLEKKSRKGSRSYKIRHRKADSNLSSDV